MIDQLKRFLPGSFKRTLRAALKAVRYRYRRIQMRRAVARLGEIKIILGAAETSQLGWFASNEQWLDITKEEDWISLFKGRRMITRAVAEHVFEHLTHEEAARALNLVAKHLVPGGRLRIAVPDGYNPNPEYLRHVCVGGIGDDAADHKQLLNVDVLSSLLRKAGFLPTHVEGYVKSGELVRKPWSSSDGYVRRSRQNAPNAAWHFPDATTSLIVDGVLQ